MSARNRMTMRCDTTRLVEGATLDRYDEPITEPQPVNTELACYVWPVVERQVTQAVPPEVVTIATHRMIAPIDSDLVEGDRVARVYDRRDDDLYPAMTITSSVNLKTVKDLTMRQVS